MGDQKEQRYTRKNGATKIKMEKNRIALCNNYLIHEDIHSTEQTVG